MSNLYVNRRDQLFLSKVLARYRDELIDDAYDDPVVDHSDEVVLTNHILDRINRLSQ